MFDEVIWDSRCGLINEEGGRDGGRIGSQQSAPHTCVASTVVGREKERCGAKSAPRD